MDILSKNNAVPLYEQLKLSLRKQIDQRILPEGAQLPTEAELCKAYNVSRITVRRAVEELVDKCVLERRQGKGTFVATKRVPMQMMSLDDVAKGFYDNPLGRRQTRVLSKKEYTASQYERSMLGLAQGELVHVFTRLMLLDGELLMLDRSIYPASRYPGFFDKVVDDVSTYRILREEYGVKMHRSHKEISHTYASSEQARQMGCAIGTPLFKMFKVVYDSHDAPIHMSSSYLLADGIIFIADREL